MFWCFGKKGGIRHCKIVLLDETEFIQEIQEHSKGQQLLDVVFKHLNLMETAYFGLRYLDSSGQRHWLDPNKKIINQLKGIETFTFYFGVKFYASDPCKLLEEITRYQFFLQVKQDIYQGRLPLTFDLAAELFAYAVQSELGDYDSRRHQSSYISEFNFSPNQTPDLEAKAAEIHKSLCGRVPAVAELNFLDRVKWLDMYGVDLHPVLGEDNIEYFMGLTPSGVLVLRNKTKVGNYFWPRITKVYYKRKYFMIRVRDKSNEENTYGFELPSKQACKHLWKCCVDHRAFFKLTQVREIPGQPGKGFGLENKLNYCSKQDKMAGMHTRLRTPPTFIRVPSRRFQRRLGQPDGADAGTQAQEEVNTQNCNSDSKTPVSPPAHLTLSQSLHRSTSVPSVVPYAGSNGRVVAAPWEDPRLSTRGLYSSSANPSPRSVRSAGALPSKRHGSHHRSGSVDSTSNYEYRKRKHHSGRRQSDNDSEISRSSRCSKSSRSSRHWQKKHGSQSGDGSDSETQHRHRRHSRRKKHGSTYELVDSEDQWKEIQRQNQEQSQLRLQNAVVRDLSKRKSGYMNSGLETESETNYTHRRRHRRHRSRSKSPDSKNPIPSEVKRYIEYNLIDPSSLTEEEKRDIKYTKVQADSRLFKIRYSSSSGQSNQVGPLIPRASSGNIMTSKIQNSEISDSGGPPPPYVSVSHNGYLPQDESLVDVPSSEENSPLTTQASKSYPQNGISRSSNLTSFAETSYSQNNSTTDWKTATTRPAMNFDRSNKVDFMMNGEARDHQDNIQYSGQDRLSSNIRMVNGHFYLAHQKPQANLSTTHRVTFQGDNVAQQHPKNFSTSRSWSQCTPRQSSEVANSADPALPQQNSHEMSTEL